MGAQVLGYFELCSLTDETFEKLLMIISNHQSIYVNNLKIADQLSKILKYQTISVLLYPAMYIVAYPSSLKYAGRSDV